jgi:hypothetical protein
MFQIAATTAASDMICAQLILLAHAEKTGTTAAVGGPLSPLTLIP